MNDVTHPSRRTLAANAVNPSSEQVLYVPLGGTGEIGMNLNLYGHAGSWLMVDCGMMMDRDHGGLDVLVPDPEFINAHRDSLEAIVLTHAHMDHIGALAWIWPQLQCPIIATRFTAAMVARELANRLPEPVLENLALRIVNPGDTIEIGPFAVEWLTLTHSIPEPCALVIKTTVGTVFHTGDWKLDPAPVVGDNYDEQRIREVGREGVSALIGDSTNATVPGVSGSESSLREPLTQLAREATGRVVVTCFASNVARLFTLARVAADSGRRLCLLGAGLEKTAGLARSTGYWDDDIALVPARHVAYLPREEVLAVATGSQGESSAALARLALGTHRDLDLDAGDRIIFSAREIPGNESAISVMVERFAARNIDVVRDGPVATHVSGHPHAEELATLYGWVKPRLLVPTHGEAKHLAANAAVGRSTGIPITLDARNGDVCVIVGGQPGILGRVATGRITVDDRSQGWPASSEHQTGRRKRSP